MVLKRDVPDERSYMSLQFAVSLALTACVVQLPRTSVTFPAACYPCPTPTVLI